MSVRAFVPRESVADALGATSLAGTLAESGHDVVRNGSRGLLWAEPMVEIERDGRRTAYGRVGPDDVETLESHELGAVDDLLAGQQRVIFRTCGIYEPTSLEAYRSYGGFRETDLSPEEIIEEITTAGLRGYGGAAFPAGIKWRAAAETPADQRKVEGP